MNSKKTSYLRALLPVLMWIVLSVIPAPAGLEANAWRYFALFVAVITGLILEPIATAAIGFLGITAAVLFRFVAPTAADSIKWGLSGFSNTTVWLIFGAFMLSMGYEKSGLGRRIALVLVRMLGRNTLGLGYAIALADLAIAPVTPSNTARSAGTIFPIIRNIPALFGSEPGPTSRRIGSYIMWNAFAVTGVTSSLFLTGLAPNLLALSFVKQYTGVEIQWVQWMVGFLPMGLLLFVAVPFLVYLIYPPEVKKSPEVSGWASDELKKMGGMSAKEWLMALSTLLALSLWIFGRGFVHATTVVWIVISFMLLTRIIEWDDILANKSAWNVLVWFATLVALADGLKKTGFVEWATSGISASLSGFSPLLIMAGFVIFFFVSHYLFASITAHATAVMPILLTLGKAVPNMPIVPLSLLLCYAMGIMGVITPYATGPAPVYYGSGYISRADFWRLGAIFGVIYIAVLVVIGIPYLNAIY